MVCILTQIGLVFHCVCHLLAAFLPPPLSAMLGDAQGRASEGSGRAPGKRALGAGATPLALKKSRVPCATRAARAPYIRARAFAPARAQPCAPTQFTSAWALFLVPPLSRPGTVIGMAGVPPATPLGSEVRPPAFYRADGLPLGRRAELASRRKDERHMPNAGANKKARCYQRTPAASLTNHVAFLDMRSSADCQARALLTQREGDHLFP